MQRNFYASFSVLSGIVAILLGAVAKTELAIASGAVSIVWFILFIRKNRLHNYAALIRDNCIFAVPSALISATDGTGQKHTEETVVSTFGIMIGEKIYRWGLDGVHGVRLSSIEINRQRMILIFGDTFRTIRIELLHGMTEKEQIIDVKQKFLHETGVAASICGW